MSPATVIGGAAFGVIVGVVIGAAVSFLVYRQRTARQRNDARDAAARIIEEAEAVARETVLAAKDEALEIRDEAEREVKRRRRELDEDEARLSQRREKLDHRFDQTESRAQRLDARERRIREKSEELDSLEAKRLAELERIAHMDRDQAREELLARVAEASRADQARIVREIEMQARQSGERRAREILVTCMQRLATDVASDNVASTVPLPSDEMKGRIIGRQGRNIRAFELATGVDVIVDDTPEAVLLSCFDPVRREVGRLALSRLVSDGRIHPARIEQIVDETQQEIDQTVREAGESAAYDAGVHGLHGELVALLGRLKFRTSYGQNVLDHSVEAAHLAGMLAQELGADADASRAGALLHDIGKAVSHEVEGPHALIGGDIARRYGVSERVVNAIASHHHEVEQESLEAVIVETADAISGSRPGARRESLELYLKRIRALENVANAFDGVEECYAIQAGREIRVIVRPEDLDDLAAQQLSRQIARKVEESLEYPGQVKVTVIRETRSVNFAK